MIKTQVQVPEELIRKLRRDSEPLLQVDTDSPPADTVAWTAPTSSKEGWKGLSAAQLVEAAFADSDPILASHLAP